MRAVRSFDVFDTVLTRTVGDPDVVVALLAERLERDGACPVAAPVLAAARKRHERRLNRFAGRHVTLREIWTEVADTLNAAPELAQQWALAEEQLDRELTIAVPGAPAMLAALRAEGHQVVFVSDTPHSEAFVRELLERQGLAADDDLVFTSSERGATKSRGGLFEAVAAELGPERSYLHHGDNRGSDLGSARLEGWDSALLTRARLTRYEHLLEQRSVETDRLTSWLAGASRLARLEARERGVPAAVADVASGSMAPFLVGYVLWVLGQARRRGLKRLYFAARDGEIMLAVAREVIGRLAPDIELRYLHGSRQPWIFGACATSDAILAHWATGRSGFTARTLLDRFDLDPVQVHDLTGLPATAPDRLDTPLTVPERFELADRLQAEPLLPLVRAAAARSAERTTTYLRQEGLLDGTPYAVVDAGWNGRTAAGLDQLLIAAGAPPVPHLLVGVLGLESQADLRRDVQLVPWLFDRPRHPTSVLGLHEPNVLVEMFCAGTQGRTAGYARDEAGVVHPVLDHESNEPALAWGLSEIQRIALRVAELVAPRLREADAHVDATASSWDVLTAFWSHPTRAEVEAWGTFPGEEEIWPPLTPLATPITAPAMARRVLAGERTMRQNNTWRAGSALASNHPWRGLLKAKAWREVNQDRLRRVPRRLRLEVAYRRKR